MKKVVFNENECKGCMLCVDVCPRKIIKINTDVLNEKGYNPATIDEADYDKCISCAMCAKMCPDCVITVYKE
ncbi:MAG: 4Fe-4S binding protein [Clostridia bacterium]